MSTVRWFHFTQRLGRFYCIGCRRRVRGRGRWVWARGQFETPGWFRAIRRRCACGRSWAVQADAEFSVAVAFVERASEGTAGT